jgi:hypothetical protein
MVDFVDNEDPGLVLGAPIYREEVFSAAGALTFPAGMVVGRITASGKITFYASGAGDGTAVPMGALVNELVTTGAGDTNVRILMSGTVREDQLLVWTAGTPVVPTSAELQLLHTYGIIGQADRELQRFDNNT